MATAAFISVASMAGIAPTIGFVAKESTLTALLDDAQGGSPWGLVALIGIVLGSMLTAAYGVRFLWGAFWKKRDEQGGQLPDTAWPDPPVGFLSAPIILAGVTLAAGIGAPALDTALQGYALTATPGSTTPVRPSRAPGHLALWHGFEPALGISILSIVLGIGLFLLTRKTGWDRKARFLRFTAADVYYPRHARGRPALGAQHHAHAARFAAGLRRHDLRRVRRRRGHGADRERHRSVPLVGLAHPRRRSWSRRSWRSPASSPSARRSGYTGVVLVSRSPASAWWCCSRRAAPLTSRSRRSSSRR